MAAISTIVAVGALVIGAASYVAAESARSDAKSAAQDSAREQRKSQAEVKALNAQKAANEQRQQVREERIRRARVEQSSENSGVSGSSGELGAVGGLATQLGANIGTNLGQLAGTNRIGIFNQNAADFNTQAQNSMSDSQGYQNLMGLSMNIFNASGGFGNFTTKTPAKTT